MTIAPPSRPATLWPLSDNPLVAGSSLHEWQSRIADEHAPAEAALIANAWVTADDWQALATTAPGTRLLSTDGELLAWHGAPSDEGPSLTASPHSGLLQFPWDVLELNESLLSSLQADQILGEVHPAAHVEGTLHLGRGSRILPGVFIEGHVIIGDGCKIGPNCYIRGNTTIGNRCHIGQSVEIKNSIIGHDTAIGHLSYVGDSILGNKVNFGAGTIVSNYRHDAMPHRSLVNGKLTDTGRLKFGTIVGDGVHTGIHTAIYPGRKIGTGATTLPQSTVTTDIDDGDEV
ncbi:hypothetical protein [Sulfuriroseicoccus oceanibius]|uniref:Mannose-1-phosphate guanyltransferase C-terminal domain-containing protein n=1 Tax=Sulfuriroseicoccus oceanibius TaxID=2707525 RepID=A0A6B3LDL0_9BACT|nr:hypothetical protein [Sulfuriroseicoccus oceanibius]QQL45144.1 hypothetical protein G3M56_000725 [Sulfuriroseicoccus oceanibius]